MGQFSEWSHQPHVRLLLSFASWGHLSECADKNLIYANSWYQAYANARKHFYAPLHILLHSYHWQRQIKASGQALRVWMEQGGKELSVIQQHGPCITRLWNCYLLIWLWMGRRKQSDRFCFLLFQINRALVKPEVNLIPRSFKNSQLHSGTGKNVNRACNPRAGQNTHRFHMGESMGPMPRKMKC